MSGLLAAKVALVTGSSSGIGRAIAIKLACLGVKIVSVDLQEQPNVKGYETDLEKTTTQVISESGGNAFFFKADITDGEAIEALFNRIRQEYGRLDILVNCAGYWAPFHLFIEETDELWAKMTAVNTLGTAKMSRHAIREFLQQNYDSKWGSRGRIVNISSCAGVVGFPGEVAYSATKASVNHMTRAAALDHARDFINVNCVAPGVVATGLARGNLEDTEIHELMRKATPWPRLGTAEDIAEVVVFLCKSESQWMTGQVLAVDGGLTIGVAPAT
ncbi:NAD(P)-binding protein [Colletotrichum asianum]|uniref:Short-chain dehydrogenase reductase sdr n=1 Tax=Colletotrichum asianum TaxID=702518 RepID=A0A8H3VUM5_9PEZI|nr:short-chain dehydrogenase reductase sdr [Colletotrichum asianum]